MTKHQLSVATMTWARDEQEERILRDSLKLLAETGLTVHITDGGSNAGFLSFLNAFPQFHVYRAAAKGVWAQVRNSLEKAYASNTDFILYTEPDKQDFFQQHLASFLEQSSLANDTGVTIASRSAAGFSSFPAFQQMTETTINNCCAEITGFKKDFTYGPFVLSRMLVPYLAEVKEDIGWGWRPFICCLAKRLGYRIENFVGDYYCPVDQRNDEPSDRIYRMKQLQQNIQGILLSASVTV